MNIDIRDEVIGLVKELLESDTTEERDSEIAVKLKRIVPDPYCLDYIFQSDEFVNSDGSFDYEGLIKKCFDDYEPNIIAL